MASRGDREEQRRVVNAEKWKLMKQLFASALELPEGEREAFLRHACGGDERLVAELQALLSAHDSTISGLMLPSLSDLRAAGKWEGQRIGPYRVLHRIGSGGMGDVYLAARADDVFSKRVAIEAGANWHRQGTNFSIASATRGKYWRRSITPTLQNCWMEARPTTDCPIS